MALSMEYGDFKPHEPDVFELDPVIAYKISSKFNSQNVLMEVNLKNFLPRKLPAIAMICILFVVVFTLVGQLIPGSNLLVCQ